MRSMNKLRRLVDKKTYYATQKFYCEVCYQRAYGGPHHCISRGAGGPDAKENLIQLCQTCHRQAHDGNIPRQKLWEVIARREGMEVAEIQRAVNIMRGRDV